MSSSVCCTVCLPRLWVWSLFVLKWDWQELENMSKNQKTLVPGWGVRRNWRVPGLPPDCLLASSPCVLWSHKPVSMNSSFALIKSVASFMSWHWIGHNFFCSSLVLSDSKVKGWDLGGFWVFLCCLNCDVKNHGEFQVALRWTSQAVSVALLPVCLRSQARTSLAEHHRGTWGFSDRDLWGSPFHRTGGL
jgi:hypothetical protein